MLGSILGGIAKIGGGLISNFLGNKAADEQADLQKEFAQNSIQWRVADAKKAGIHPLYALGAQPSSYSPVSVGDSLGPALQDMGQDLSRAAAAADSPSGRTASVLANLSVERAGLENELLRSQIARINSAQVGPGFPGNIGSTDPTGLLGSQPGVKGTLMPRVFAGNSGSSDPGSIPDVGWARTKTGFVPVPSLDVKQRIEDVMPHEWAHYIRNNLLPGINSKYMNVPFAARPGEKWIYTNGEYRLVPISRGDMSPIRRSDMFN